MAIKVYGVSTYNAQRVTLALLEFGVEDFELVKVDLATYEHLKPEFLAIQPFAQIPVFEWGDFRLYESRAIVRFIAEKFKDQGPTILGTTLEEQAVVNQWVETEAHQFNDVAFAPWTLEYYLGYRENRPLKEDLVLAALRARLETFFDRVEARLSTSKYLAGHFYSMADLNISPSLLRVMALQPDLITTRTHVKAWYDEITSRPSFTKMLQADAAWPFPYGPFPKDTTVPTSSSQ